MVGKFLIESKPVAKPQEIVKQIPFVNVILKGTSTGTSADMDGNYTISAPADGTLVFSYIGYATREIAINGQTEINVNLAEDLAALDQVVVVGYGTQQKKDLTSAVSVVDSEQISKR